MKTEYERIARILSEKAFDTLTETDWELIILSLIQEEEDMIAAHEPRGSRKFTDLTLHVDIHLSLSGRDLHPISGAASLFPHMLPFVSKQRFCQAISNLTKREYQKWKDTGTSALQEMLEFARSFQGSLDPAIAGEILLDRRLDVWQRWIVGLHLIIEYDFRLTPPDTFWDELERQITEFPVLAVWPMKHHAKRRPFETLSLLGRIAPEKVTDDLKASLERPCRVAYGVLYRRSDVTGRFKQIFEQLHPWAQEFLEKDVIPCPL